MVFTMVVWFPPEFERPPEDYQTNSPEAVYERFLDYYVEFAGRVQVYIKNDENYEELFWASPDFNEALSSTIVHLDQEEDMGDYNGD